MIIAIMITLIMMMMMMAMNNNKLHKHGSRHSPCVGSNSQPI